MLESREIDTQSITEANFIPIAPVEYKSKAWSDKRIWTAICDPADSITQKARLLTLFDPDFPLDVARFDLTALRKTIDFQDSVAWAGRHVDWAETSRRLRFEKPEDAIVTAFFFSRTKERRGAVDFLRKIANETGIPLQRKILGSEASYRDILPVLFNLGTSSKDLPIPDREFIEDLSTPSLEEESQVIQRPKRKIIRGVFHGKETFLLV